MLAVLVSSALAQPIPLPPHDNEHPHWLLLEELMVLGESVEPPLRHHTPEEAAQLRAAQHQFRDTQTRSNRVVWPYPRTQDPDRETMLILALMSEVQQVQTGRYHYSSPHIPTVTLSQSKYRAIVEQGACDLWSRYAWFRLQLQTHDPHDARPVVIPDVSDPRLHAGFEALCRADLDGAMALFTEDTPHDRLGRASAAYLLGDDTHAAVLFAELAGQAPSPEARAALAYWEVFGRNDLASGLELLDGDAPILLEAQSIVAGWQHWEEALTRRRAAGAERNRRGRELRDDTLALQDAVPHYRAVAAHHRPYCGSADAHRVAPPLERADAAEAAMEDRQYWTYAQHLSALTDAYRIMRGWCPEPD